MLAVNQPYNHDNEVTPAAVDLTFPALYALRAEIAAAGEEVARAVARQRQAALAQANVTDIVAMLRTGLDAAARDYESRLALFATRPDPEAVAALFGPDAAAYFLKDLIVSKLPGIVTRVCPEAARGPVEAARRQGIADAAQRADAVWEALDALRQRLGLAVVTLRDQRMAHYGDAKMQPAIEDQQRMLNEDAERIKGYQAALRDRPAAAAPPPVAARSDERLRRPCR